MSVVIYSIITIASIIFIVRNFIDDDGTAETVGMTALVFIFWMLITYVFAEFIF